MMHFALRRVAQHPLAGARRRQGGARARSRARSPRALVHRPVGRGQVDHRQPGREAAARARPAHLPARRRQRPPRPEQDLGFTDADRVENIRRVAEVAKLMVDAGLIVLVSFISPFRAERRMARELLERRASSSRSSSTRRSRWPRSATRRASTRRRARGELKNFTGIDSPYEAPEHPEIRIDTTQAHGRAVGRARSSTYLQQAGVLGPAGERRSGRSGRPPSGIGERIFSTGAPSFPERGKVSHALGLRLRRPLRNAGRGAASSRSPQPLPPGQRELCPMPGEGHGVRCGQRLSRSEGDTLEAGVRSGRLAPSACLPFQARGKRTGSVSLQPASVSAVPKLLERHEIGRLRTSLDRERHDAPLVRAHGELAAERRERALVAVGPLADAAADADRHGLRRRGCSPSE